MRCQGTRLTRLRRQGERYFADIPPLPRPDPRSLKRRSVGIFRSARQYFDNGAETPGYFSAEM